MWIVWAIINLLVAIVLMTFAVVSVCGTLYIFGLDAATKYNLYSLTDPVIYTLYRWLEEVLYENKYSAIVSWYARQLNKLAIFCL